MLDNYNEEFIAGIGATNVDLLYIGMPRVPNEGEEVYSKDFSMQLGGGLPATLINLSRLGIKTKIATILGYDVFSEFARKCYKDNNVSPMSVNLDCDDKIIPINLTSAIITENDRTFITHGSSEFVLDVRQKKLAFSTCKGAKIVQMQPGNFLDEYKKLKENGSLLVLDMGWDDEMSFEKYNDYLEIADYYTPNTKEALKITGCDNLEDAARSLNKYFKQVIIKLDKDGCLIYDGKEFFTVKSINEFKHIDSTGAGDAFLAGFIYGLYHSHPIRKCVLFGNITGGKCVTGIGCLTEYVNEKELLELAEKYNDYI